MMGCEDVKCIAGARVVAARARTIPIAGSCTVRQKENGHTKVAHLRVT